MQKLLPIALLFVFLSGSAFNCMTEGRSGKGQDSISNLSTTAPVTHTRDSRYYNWLERHQEIVKLNGENPPKNIIIGNSIIHYWGGEPGHWIKRGEKAWNKYLAPFEIRNLGFGSDRIENVLWRVSNGELDGYEAENIVILIGTNNLKVNTDAEIIEGLALLIDVINRKQPNAEITLSGILPRRDMEKRIRQLNISIKKTASSKRVTYIDPGTAFLNKDKKIDESLFSDGLHPNEVGYEKLGEILKSCFE